MSEDGNKVLTMATVAKLDDDERRVTIPEISVFAPPLRPIFKTTGLTATELAVCLTLPLILPITVEIEKALIRRGLITHSATECRR